jgi:myo-inositol 2-dehydrogenase/D-chiro-inositol 1-dehydrogenase
MAPFRLGLIGAGRMGRTHLRALAGSQQVAVTAIAEMSAAARDAVAAPGISLYESPAAMLADASLDGVLIVAPTDQHGAIIAEVAAAGLPILCEKPCGLTAAAARASAEVAAAAGVPLQVAYWRRFVPGLRQLHDRIASGSLGVIHLVTCYQWDEQPPSPLFRAHSGGIAIDMGVHEFDQLRWLTGQDITSLAVVTSGPVSSGTVSSGTVSSGTVSSNTGPDGIADVDGAQVILTLSGGATGFVSLGRYYPVGDIVWAEAFGTRGSERCDVIDPAEGEVAQLEALRRQAESFALHALGGPCEGATADDAVAALTAAEQVSAAIPAMSPGESNPRADVSAGLAPSYRHRPGG